MKIIITLLVLSSVLLVKTYPGVFHKITAVTGCDPYNGYAQPVYNGEYMVGLDGEVIEYVDFIKGKEVMAQPSFVNLTDKPGYYLVGLKNMHFCRSNLGVIQEFISTKPQLEQDEPHSSIYTKREVELGVDNVLICHVTGFYPAPVNITWTRNNHIVTNDSDITTSVPYPNGDGTFNQLSSLKFHPEQGDIYSCTVNHLSLTEPETREWDVDQTQDQRRRISPAVFCGVGLALGLLSAAMGTFLPIEGRVRNYVRVAPALTS